MRLACHSMNPAHVYEVRPRKDHRGVDLTSDALPFGGLWYGEPNVISNAIGYAKFFSRSRQARAKYAQDLGKPRGPSEHKIGFRIASMVSV
jgi:hypothetical protein